METKRNKTDMGSFHSATRIKISDDTRAVVDITKAITSADAKMFKLVSGKSIASFVKKVMKIDGMTTEEKKYVDDKQAVWDSEVDK